MTEGEALVAAIRAVLAVSPFTGEGYRKVWAKLRAEGIRSGKSRVLRLPSACWRRNAAAARGDRGRTRGRFSPRRRT